MSEKKKSAAKKAGLTVLIVIVIAAALYALFVLFANPLFYRGFYSSAEQAGTIPDLWGGFIPQGVTSLEGRLLICGYSSGGASRVYLFGDDGAKKLFLSYEDGSVYEGHAGGISAGGEYVYISNAEKIFAIRASELLAAADGEKISFAGRFDVPVRSSFCSCDGKNLYVGEFHRDGYKTDESHRVKTADGDYQAMIFSYPLDHLAPFGVGTQPNAVYAVCDEVQGAAFDGGKAALSCSYGLASSRIRIYDAAGAQDGSFTYEGAELPLYIFDSSREVRTVSAPHMSEDVEFSDGKLLIAFESGVLKYGGGLLPFSERRVMLFDPNGGEKEK